MRHLSTVFCSLALLVMIGTGSTVYSADTPPDAAIEAWDAGKLCSQDGTSSSRCAAIIDAVSGKGKPLSFPSSGNTLTDAIVEALNESLVRELIKTNSRDSDGVRYQNAYIPCMRLDFSKSMADIKAGMDVCNKNSAKIEARIIARAKAAIGDKHRFRHCKESLVPVDDPNEIVKCLEKLDAILASCGSKKPCVTDNFTAYSALLIYTRNSDDKDRYGPFVSRCQEQYRNLSGLGYREIWACVQNYLGLLNEAPDRTDGN